MEMFSKYPSIRKAKEFKTEGFLFIFIVYAVSCLLPGSVILSSERVFAADYPQKPITYIVSNAVGGKSDLMVRAITPFVQERLGARIIVENKPGVVKIGLNKIWNSKPDGYTLGAFPLPSPVVTELTSETEYRSREFTHIYAWSDASLIMHVNANGPKDMAEFFRLAKSRTLTGATGAFGSGPHLASLVMAQGLGIKVNWVNYNSGGESNTVLAGGHVDFNVVGASPQTTSLQRSGRLRPLMVLADEKDAFLPETPTPKDLGYTFKNFPIIEGVAAPKNLPRNLLNRLENAFAEAAKDPKFRKWAAATDTHIIHLPSKAYSQRVAETYAATKEFKDLLKSEK
jgi:tripartite-type tricarboxylate transporter receptor subunit TctC